MCAVFVPLHLRHAVWLDLSSGSWFSVIDDTLCDAFMIPK